MDVIFRLHSVEFEWDEEKYAVNLQKHGVKFEDAAQVFFDLFCQFGDTSVEEETREFVVGFSFSFQLLFAVFVERGERVRIISARETTETEKEIYVRRK
jgi:uncharacterized protein